MLFLCARLIWPTSAINKGILSVSTTKTVIVDEGSSQIKAVWTHDGQLHTCMIKAKAEYKAMETSAGTIANNVYHINGHDITAGNNVMNPVTTTSEHYQTSDINRALVHEVLRQAGFGGQIINLIVTLPVDLFYNREKRENKKRHMMQPVTNINGLPLASFNSVMVAPESVPALDGIRLDDDGQELPSWTDFRRMLIVDIGGTTTDITIVNYENQVEHRKSERIGVFNIAGTLRERLQNDPDIDAKSPNDDTIDITLRTGLFRNKTCVKDHIQAASREIAGRLLSAMNSLLPDPDDVDYILYTGGGAPLLELILSEQFGGNTLHHENPEFAVAIGLMKNHIAATKEEIA